MSQAILYLTNDLMFASRIEAVAHQCSAALICHADVETLVNRLDEQSCRLVLIDLAVPDLDLESAVSRFRAAMPQAHLLAYGAHVMEGKLAAARAAGLDSVLTRGQFNQQAAEIVRRSVT